MNPKDVHEEFKKRGTAWAEAHFEAAQLEDQLKPFLAQLTIEAKSIENCSMAEAKEIGLSATAYRTAISDANKARLAANLAKVSYDAINKYFEATRTAEATERAAMRSAT